ncbi:MAG: hypothetical protein ACOY45_15760 [Pseudomonadota bacterium]
MEPYEIIGAPFTLWLAPVGTAFPLIDAAPGGAWKLVGSNGDENYTEDGVTIQHSQTINKVRTAGSVGARKALRDSEDMMVSLTLLDMTLEQYALALNGNEVETTAAGIGTAGYKTLGLSRGEEVTTYALLVRGPSPYAPGMNAQFEVPRCYESGSPQPVFRKGQPAGLALQFDALEDPDAASADERFGRLIAQHLAALSE